MAFLNGYMPGETYGMPDSYGQGFGGLLSGDNPLLNVGLGILANNNGNYGSFGAAIGKGGLQGIQQTQQARQLAQQKQLRDLQMQQEQQKMEEYRAQQDALKDFDIKHPEYAGLARLDPKSALKIAYPQLAANSADPYYQFLPTAGGYASGNARTGKVEMVLDANGRPIVKASDSPELQGRIAGAKEAAQADYKVNTSIPGKIMTERQVAEQANPMLRQPIGLPPQPQSLPQLPQANVQGDFNGDPNIILRQINRISDPQERANALQAFTQQYGQMQPMPQRTVAPQQLPAPVSNSLVGGGIRVPTPAEQAALTEQAKANVDVQKQSDLNKQKQTQGAEKGVNTLNAMMRYLYPDSQPIRDNSGRLIPPKDVPLLGNNLTDRALMAGHEYGIHNDKASNLLGTRRLINSLVLDANNGSLGAGVSNADVEFLKGIQGVVNSAQDPKDIYNAIADNEERFNRILGVAQQQGTNTAKGVPSAGKKSSISSGGWSARKVP